MTPWVHVCLFPQDERPYAYCGACAVAVLTRAEVHTVFRAAEVAAMPHRQYDVCTLCGIPFVARAR